MVTVNPQAPLGLFSVDELLDEDDRAMRDTVRRYVEDRVKSHIADWYEDGAIPARDPAKELGSLGVLDLLHEDPARPWRPREIAARFGDVHRTDHQRRSCVGI
ncbi:acyl-CoA dehydrogenase family protein [Streptomyces sp. NPDC058175]|uniref:acyl-CoA dehydrogenase family protein n=1 Tax=Streptomyces sp. NPDC058175 TaxID=3346367 RepID=UPI0036ECB245